MSFVWNYLAKYAFGPADVVKGGNRVMASNPVSSLPQGSQTLQALNTTALSERDSVPCTNILGRSMAWGNFGFLLTAIEGQSIARTVPPESVQTAPFLAARI